MIHRDKWFEAFILLHLKPLASCGSLGSSLACIVYIDNNILLHLKPLASCGSLVCKFEVSRPFQSYLLTGYEPCALTSPTASVHCELRLSVFVEGSVRICTSCVLISLPYHLVLILLCPQPQNRLPLSPLVGQLSYRRVL